MSLHDEDDAEPRARAVRPARSGMAPARRDQPMRRPWLPWAVAGAIAAIAIVVVLLVTVLSSSNDAATAYRGKVDAILRPVVRANASLSRALADVHGTSSAAAQRAAAVAQDATLSARGGLAALTVPSGSEQLASNARGTLTREANYLAAVKEALSNPGNGSAAQTQTLAANLTDALDVVAPASEDWSSSVTGADTLTAWASRAAAAIARKQRAARLRRQAQAGAAAPAAPAGASSCGDNVYAGPNTSCPFALNTRRAYEEAPGLTATVAVYSPVTGQTYSMSCAPAGNGVTCSGANNASVTWTY